MYSPYDFTTLLVWFGEVKDLRIGSHTRWSNECRFLWITRIVSPSSLHITSKLPFFWFCITFQSFHFSGFASLSLSLETPKKIVVVAAMGVSFLSTCPSLLSLVANDTPPSTRYHPRSVSFLFALPVSFNTQCSCSYWFPKFMDAVKRHCSWIMRNGLKFCIEMTKKTSIIFNFNSFLLIVCQL